MKIIKQIPLFLFLALTVSIFSSCSKENSNVERSLEEVKMLIQNDEITLQLKKDKERIIQNLLNEGINDPKEISSAIHKYTKPLSLVYHQKILIKYPETSSLSDEVKLETIYNISITELEEKISTFHVQNENPDEATLREDCGDWLDLHVALYDLSTITKGSFSTFLLNLANEAFDNWEDCVF